MSATPGNDQTSPSDAGGMDDAPLDRAKAPVGTGTSPIFGQLIALLLIGLGVVGVQEAVARTGLATTSWTSWVLTRLDHQSASFSILVMCVVLALVGLVLLVVVFKPRPRKTLTLSATTGVYLRATDLARIAQDAVHGADGVADVDASASRSRLKVRVTTLEPSSGNDGIGSDVRERIQPTLEALTNPPRVSVEVVNQELT